MTGLELPRGILRTYDDAGNEVMTGSLNGVPVYIKYNSSTSGDAYMKPFDGDFTGVIFQPRLMKIDDELDKVDEFTSFKQFGNLPSGIFK